MVAVVALLGAATAQPAVAAVEPSASPQTDGKLLIITVPKGGSVRSLSNNHLCGAGETCEIPIDDGFHEVFIPWHEVGYRFNAWKQSSEHFCGGHIVKCTITAGSADSATRLEPVFDRDVASTGYEGIRRLDDRDLELSHSPVPIFAAQVYADFNGDGILDMFRAVGKWLSIERQHVEMWIGNSDGSYSQDESTFVDPGSVGFHPRKAVVADFNGDDKADVIVADHGYDDWPFPGAPLLLYLSTADGRLKKAKGLEYFTGYHHSVAVGDIDGDGDADAFVTDWWPAFLINDGEGNLTRDRAHVPRGLTLGYTSELTDVDHDGHVDLLISCADCTESYGSEVLIVFWGDAEPGFADSTASILLPEVTDFGIIVDIDVGDIDGDGINDVLLNRVGSPPGRGFYDGSYLQLLKGLEDRRTFSDITASSIDNEVLLNRSTSPGGWFLWLVLQDWDFDGDLDILVDKEAGTGPSFVMINKGRSLFSTLEVVLQP